MYRKAVASLSRLGSKISGRREGEGVRILMYHGVDENSSVRLCVKPSEFRKQMELLSSRGAPVIGLNDFFSLDTYSPPPVIITFDDGYRDFYDQVYPVLKEFNLPAAVFVVPDFIDRKLDRKASRLNDGLSPLNWEMVRELAAGGVTVGSHSLTHRELINLPADRAEMEIRESRRRIAEETGNKPRWFSYPRGKYNQRISRAVRKAGYRGAVTVRPGLNRVPFQFFDLRRTEISRTDDLTDFGMKISGAFDFAHSLWQKFRGNRL